MRPGDIVRFTTTLYDDWGLGLIICEHRIVDRDGVVHPGYYWVLTQCGEKVVSDSFMEKIE